MSHFLFNKEVEEHTPRTGDSAIAVPGTTGLEHDQDLEKASLQTDGLKDIGS